MPPKRDRLGWHPWAMIPVALLFDLLSIIPVINIVAAVLALCIFGLWFGLLGANLLNLKRLGALLLGFIIEIPPGVSLLPGTTLSIIAVILMIKSEDKLGIKLPLKS